MGSDKGDIAIRAGAEFRVVVTRLGVCWAGAGGRSGSSRVRGTVTTAGGAGGSASGALEEGDTGGGGGALRGAAVE